MISPKQIGQNIQKERELTGLSRPKLMEVTGLDKAQLYRIEKGLQNPTIKTLIRLAEGIGCDPARFWQS